MSRRVAYYGKSRPPSFIPFFQEFANGLVGLSLDRLVTGFTGRVLTIVRPSDLATKDIFLNGNSIDQAEILSFVGSQKALVKNIYDQLGNWNMLQATVAKMPIIADGGVIKTDNGKPCIVFDGVDDDMVVVGAFTYTVARLTSLMVRRMLTTDNNQLGVTLQEAGGRQNYNGFYFTANTVFYGGSNRYSLPRTTDRQLVDTFVNGTTAAFHVNGVQQATGIAKNNEGATYLVLGNWISGTVATANMNFQELILCDNADRTSEAVAMRANINTRYAIY